VIISKEYAKRLIKAGKAAALCPVTDNGRRYIAIDRYDLQRTDHYEGSITTETK